MLPLRGIVRQTRSLWTLYVLGIFQTTPTPLASPYTGSGFRCDSSNIGLIININARITIVVYHHKHQLQRITTMSHHQHDTASLSLSMTINIHNNAPPPFSSAITLHHHASPSSTTAIAIRHGSSPSRSVSIFLHHRRHTPSDSIRSSSSMRNITHNKYNHTQ